MGLRLRTQFALLFGGSSLVAGATLVMVALAVADANSSIALQRHALEVLSQARNLLVLTQEFASYGQQRSAQQWRARFRAMTGELEAARRQHGVTDATLALGGELASLPATFEQLVSARGTAVDTAVLMRRRELLIDNLTTQTQAILEKVNAWNRGVNDQRIASERRIALLAATGPVLLIAVVGVFGWAVARQVMRPLGELQAAMARVQAGDLDVRRASTTTDELGDLARAFDRMTQSLQRSVNDLADGERLLRTISDNLPARIAYVDAGLHYRFANSVWRAAAGAPDDLLGRSWRSVAGEARYREIESEVAAALGGERRVFVRTELEGDAARQHEYSLIPDRDPHGRVRGLYAMVQDISEYVQAQTRLESALLDKDALLKEVHHRVKNNLQVINSLLRLEGTRAGHAQTRTVLGEMQGRIRSMALLHESLYRSGVFASVDLAAYLRQIATQAYRVLAPAGAAIEMRLDLDPVEIGMDQATPCGLLANELIANGLKHAFPAGQRGVLTMQLHAVAGGPLWRLRVADSGVGLPPDFDARRERALGLQLVGDLTRQIGGTLAVESGPGAAFVVTFAPEPAAAPAAVAAPAPAAVAAGVA